MVYELFCVEFFFWFGMKLLCCAVAEKDHFSLLRDSFFRYYLLK